MEAALEYERRNLEATQAGNAEAAKCWNQAAEVLFKTQMEAVRKLWAEAAKAAQIGERDTACSWAIVAEASFKDFEKTSPYSNKRWNKETGWNALTQTVEEVTVYVRKSTEATRLGNDEAARCWRKTAEALAHQDRVDGKEEREWERNAEVADLLFECKNGALKATQEGNEECTKYWNQAVEALTQEGQSLWLARLWAKVAKTDSEQHSAALWKKAAVAANKAIQYSALEATNNDPEENDDTNLQAVNIKRLNNIYSDEEIDDTDVQEENRNSVNDAASSCKYASKCWQKAAKAENKNISQ